MLNSISALSYVAATAGIIVAVFTAALAWNDFRAKKPGLRKWIELGVMALSLMVSGIPFRVAYLEDRSNKETDLKITALSSNAALLQSNNSILSNEVFVAKNKVAELEPKPLPQKIRTFLDSVDTRYLNGLRDKTNEFHGSMASFRFTELQKLAAEPGAEKYIVVRPRGHVMESMGSASGTSELFSMWLNPQLMYAQ